MKVRVGKFPSADRVPFRWKPFFEEDVWQDGTLSIYWLCFWIDVHPWYRREQR